MQENPGMFFCVVQIGLNAVAILGGIVGDAAFRPPFRPALLTICRQNSRAAELYSLSLLAGDGAVLHPVHGF